MFGRDVPWWGVLSAAAAPVLLVGGWMVAARLQPGSFDEVTRTVSSLAQVGAADRWLMTLVFLVVGACDVLIGLALRPAASPGRLILIAGGLAGMLVAASPDSRGGSLAHGFWAAVGFVALTVWPVAGCRWRHRVPWALRPGAAAGAAGVLLGLLGWFAFELISRGGQIGLAERVLGAAQALWPFAVVVSCRWEQARARVLPALRAGADLGTRR
jgi:hypothetical membrane protein